MWYGLGDWVEKNKKGMLVFGVYDLIIIING